MYSKKRKAMKVYDIDTKMTFGKHITLTLREVLDIEPSYICWCIEHLDHFLILKEDLQSMKNEFPMLTLALSQDEILASKEEKYWEELNRKNETFAEEVEKHHYDDFELENADWDYDPLNESHSQSDNPWIDVFGPGEEAETAYWNCD